jgi:NAD-dependent SIR2 family protein deacetylase
LLIKAKYPVVFTGAGISTSAQIPDFRGPQGIWTLRDKRMMSVDKGKQINEASPTYAHYAITKLISRSIIKFVISTNMDSLHVRTGIPKHLIIEQHGNCHKEVCVDCGTDYWRAFDTRDTVLNTREHFTLRFCKFCGGKLRDTIVHFSENWSERHTEILSVFHSRKSDFTLVMGTSMNVQPNATFPELSWKKTNPAPMILVNLQKTPYDNLAAIRIFTKTDTFMNLLMQELGINEFDMITDKRLEWDPVDEEDLERYYKIAYKSRRKEEEEEEDDGDNLFTYLLYTVPIALGLCYIGLMKWFKGNN